MEEILKVFMTMGVFIPVVIIALMWLGNVINDAISRQTTIWPTVLFLGGIAYFVFWLSWSISLWSGNSMWWPSMPQIDWDRWIIPIDWKLFEKIIGSVFAFIPLGYFGLGGYFTRAENRHYDSPDYTEMNVLSGLAGVSLIGWIVVLAWMWQ